MEISPYISGKNPHFIHEDSKDLILLDKLPQRGIGTLYIPTSELTNPYSAILFLSEDDIETLKEEKFENPLQEAVTRIIEYAKTNPCTEYLFFIYN